MGPPRRIDPVHWVHHEGSILFPCLMGPPRRIDPDHLFTGSATKDRSCSPTCAERYSPYSRGWKSLLISAGTRSPNFISIISPRTCLMGPPRRIDPVPLRVPNATHLTAMGGNHSDISRDAISELHLDYISQDQFNGSPTKDRSCSLGPPRRIDPVPLRVPNATHLTAVGGNHSDISRDAISELHLDYISQDLFNGSATKDRSCSPTCAERYSPYSRGRKSL